jgi:hypothetical protein
MRLMMLSLGFVFAVGATVAACGSDDAGGEAFCEAGSFVFCRCANGDPGSKECNGEGTEFGECEAQSGGACPERDDDDDSSASSNPSSSGDPGGPGGSGPGSGGAGGGGSGELYAACAGDEECSTGLCAPDGYCTKQCANYEECDWPVGDCPGNTTLNPKLPGDSVQLCAPTCGVYDESTQMSEPKPEDCSGFGLKCGFGKAADNFAILICGSWPEGIPLPPEGTECDYGSFENVQCNLGHSGLEAVCSGFDVCTFDACYGDEDCPNGKSCSASGSLGSCQ